MTSKHRLFHYPSLGIALLSALPVLLPLDWGPHWMYAVSVPWIVYWTHLLASKGFDRWYVSFVLWIPALGMITWQRAILHLDMQYLSPAYEIEHFLKLIWQNHQHGWALLTGAMIGAWFIEKRMCLILGLLALGNGVSQGLLVGILQTLTNQEWDRLALYLLSIEFLRWIPLFPLWWSYTQRPIPYQSGTNLILSLLSLWITSPFISLLLWLHPVSMPTIDLPDGSLGLGGTIPVANPAHTTFLTQLDQQGTTALPKASWWCQTEAKPNWQTETRAFALLELPPTSSLSTLQSTLPHLFVRGISHLGILTKNQNKHWYPPLAKHLDFPVNHWVLSPIPRSVRVLQYNNETLQIERDGNQHCALVTSWDMTIQSLSETYDQLQTEFQCPSPVFLSIAPQTDLWTSPVSCPQ